MVSESLNANRRLGSGSEPAPISTSELSKLMASMADMIASVNATGVETLTKLAQYKAEKSASPLDYDSLEVSFSGLGVSSLLSVDKPAASFLQ